MKQEPVNFGIDVHRLYEAHRFDLDAPTMTETNIEATWRERHGWVRPSESKKDERKTAQ
jgi:hypothetical protein